MEGMRARTGHRGRALVAAFVGLSGAFVAAVAAVPPAAAAGSVSLFDDSGGTPLFNGSVLAPGHPQTGCVSVSAAGATRTDSVVLSATGVAGSLAQYLSVSVQVGSGGHLGDCTGWVADPAVPTWSGHLGDLTPGVVTGWYPRTSSTRTFRFTVQVDDVGAASGTTAGGQFVWQLTTTPPPPPRAVRRRRPPSPVGLAVAVRVAQPDAHAHQDADTHRDDAGAHRASAPDDAAGTDDRPHFAADREQRARAGCTDGRPGADRSRPAGRGRNTHTGDEPGPGREPAGRRFGGAAPHTVGVRGCGRTGFAGRPWWRRHRGRTGTPRRR